MYTIYSVIVEIFFAFLNTVKPVLRGHLLDKEKVALSDR